MLGRKPARHGHNGWGDGSGRGLPKAFSGALTGGFRVSCKQHKQHTQSERPHELDPLNQRWSASWLIGCAGEAETWRLPAASVRMKVWQAVAPGCFRKVLRRHRS
eukprot:1537927-Rhodomonas_salina.1